MKYYQLLKYQITGMEFEFCTSKELEEVNKEFKADKITEIDKEEYNQHMEIKNRRFLRLATGYPK